MAILINASTRVLCQGFTGQQGTFHSEHMIAYGTKMVGGVSPGKSGQTHLGLPVFNTVDEAVTKCGPIDASVIYVPAPFAADAINEAASAGIGLIVCITEGIPIHDMMRVKAQLPSTTRLIGPNCPGLVVPDACKIGIMPNSIHKKGVVGIVSRSGTLTYEAIMQTSKLGQSASVGIGGDPIKGLGFQEVCELFLQDPETEVILMIGEIGGNEEQRAGDYLAEQARLGRGKPAVAYIAGATAPKGKRMGHAGAISGGEGEDAASKMAYLQQCGLLVAEQTASMGALVEQAWRARRN